MSAVNIQDYSPILLQWHWCSIFTSFSRELIWLVTDDIICDQSGVRNRPMWPIHWTKPDLFYFYKNKLRRHQTIKRSNATSTFTSCRWRHTAGRCLIGRATLWCHHTRGDAHRHQLLEKKFTGVWHPDERDLTWREKQITNQHRDKPRGRERDR